MRAGDTFDAPSGPRDHLFVVVAGPDEAGRAVIANFTSWEEDADESCVIYAGETVLLGHKSVVAYEFSKVVEMSQLDSLMQAGKIRDRCCPLRPELLDRVRKGFFASGDAQPAAKKVLRSLGVAE